MVIHEPYFKVQHPKNRKVGGPWVLSTRSLGKIYFWGRNYLKK